MNLTGKLVLHVKFGEGIIQSQDDKYIYIHFNSDAAGVEKKFSYPTCFKSFLKLLDDDVNNQVSSDLKKKEEDHKKEIKEKEIRIEAEIIKRQNKTVSRSSKENETRIPSFNSVDEFLDDYKRTLLAEMYYLKENVTKKQKLHDGNLITIKGTNYIYTFEAEDELNYPEGTPIKVWKADVSINAKVVECQEFTVIISINEYIGEDIKVIEISAEPWKLIGTLVERLEEMGENPSLIVKKLICDGFNEIDYGSCKVTTGQSEAIYMSTNQPITFIWGPPGTGKTQTLAYIALEHISRGHRVLMLSHSNVSVDGAIMRVSELDDNNKPGKLIRYGYTKREDVLDHPYLTSYNYVIHRHPELIVESKKLKEERKRLNRSNPRFVEIGEKLSKIKYAMKHEEALAVSKAFFVATTVSKASVDSAIYADEFDVVIFDEASMAFVPQIVFSASLAKKHFICMGDFVQLPPIVQGDHSKKLNIDIFKYCGITEAVEHNRNHNWLCMLDTQYRMHPKISDFASICMYNGLLKSASTMEKKRSYVVDIEPFQGEALALADLTGMMSVCMKTKDKSRVNVLSAFISLLIAVKAAKNTSVGIITPYHAQSRLIHSMIKDVEINYPELNHISCATVHQFQGSEEDVIVYDAVDCYRMQYPGMLLTSMDNNYANKLFNVALTRARGKFICVSNIAYMFNKNISPKLMFGRLLDKTISHAGYLEGKKLLKKIADDKIKLFEKGTEMEEYLHDIKNAKKEIHIDIPDNMENISWIKNFTNLLIEKKKSGVKVFVRAEKKCSVSAELKRITVENKFVVNPLTIIDKKIIWYGVPESEDYFVSEGWKLNTPYHPIIRFNGTYGSQALFGYVGMDDVLDRDTSITNDSNGKKEINSFATYVIENTKCPTCGQPLQLKKGRSGKYFLSCSSYPVCDHKEFVTVDLIESYFKSFGPLGKRCDICNCSLEAKLGKYGVYVQCCGLDRHKYKLDEI